MKKWSHFFMLLGCLSLIIVLSYDKLPAQDITFTETVDNMGITDGGMFGNAWGDYDSDGDLDLFISRSPLSLFRNDGDEFVDVAAELGVVDSVGSYPAGAAWADIDNDNDLDLLSANSGIKWFRNDGSTFTYVYEEAGLPIDDGIQLWQPTCGDYDKDGDLDIAFSGADQGQGAPELPTRILNNDNGIFFDVGADLLGWEPLIEAWNPCFLDYDNDGDLDLWLPAIRSPNETSLLFRNEGTEFVDVSDVTNIGADAAIASSWGDFDNDGDMDLFIITWTGGGTGENDMLYQNDDGVFTDIAPDLGLQGPAGNSRGCCWGDYNNDGDLDLLIGANGGNQLLYDNDGGEFTEVGEATGAGINGGFRNAMFVDYDTDGFLDIYLNENTKMLLHNEGNSNHWLGIRPRGTTSNRDGIGARVRVVTGSLSQIRDIEGGGMGGLRHGYMWAHFGLGDATTADSVIINWPMGTVDVVTDVAADQYYYFEEGTGIVVNVENRNERNIPSKFALSQNYPNPFNPTTTIPFTLAEKSQVRLVLISVLGDVIQEIACGEYSAGYHTVQFKAGNLPTGLYFYKIEADGFSAVKKLAIVK